MKHSTHQTLAAAKKAAAQLGKTHLSVIVSAQPSGYVVFHGRKK